MILNIRWDDVIKMLETNNRLNLVAICVWYLMLEWLLRKLQCISMKFRFWAYWVCSRTFDSYPSLLCLRRLLLYTYTIYNYTYIIYCCSSPCSFLSSPSRVRYISFFLSDLFLQFRRVEKHWILSDVLQDKLPNLVVMAATSGYRYDMYTHTHIYVYHII